MIQFIWEMFPSKFKWNIVKIILSCKLFFWAFLLISNMTPTKRTAPLAISITLRHLASPFSLMYPTLYFCLYILCTFLAFLSLLYQGSRLIQSSPMSFTGTALQITMVTLQGDSRELVFTSSNYGDKGMVGKWESSKVIWTMPQQCGSNGLFISAHIWWFASHCVLAEAFH